MTNYIRTSLLTIAALFLLASTVFLTPTAKAITISPVTFELIANPGDSIANAVRILNDGDSAVQVSIKVEDFVAAGEEGQVTLEEPSENLTFSLARWITVSPNTLSLGPGESGNIEFTANVPIDAEPGGHYASVLASVSGGTTSGGASVVQQVGALLLLNVAGEVNENLQIAEFSVPKFNENPPVTITSRFRNLGTVHLKPSGFVLIKNMFGREVEKLDLPQRNVLPESIRRVETIAPFGFYASNTFG